MDNVKIDSMNRNQKETVGEMSHLQRILINTFYN